MIKYIKIKKYKKIDYVGNSNYIIDAISNSNRAIFPITLPTERPDLVKSNKSGEDAFLCVKTQMKL